MYGLIAYLSRNVRRELAVTPLIHDPFDTYTAKRPGRLRRKRCSDMDLTKPYVIL